MISLLKAYHPITIDETSRSSSVLALFIHDDENNIYLLVTKRSNSLADYAGDYSFPGGMREPSDNDYIVTAQRETEEEIGLKQDCYELLGQLDDFKDRYGNLVRPYTAIMSKLNFETYSKKSDAEIENFYYFPIADLKKIEVDPKLELITNRHPSYRYTKDSITIWGLTASIMVHLGNIIFALNKPLGKVNKKQI